MNFSHRRNKHVRRHQRKMHSKNGYLPFDSFRPLSAIKYSSPLLYSSLFFLSSPVHSFTCSHLNVHQEIVQTLYEHQTHRGTTQRINQRFDLFSMNFVFSKPLVHSRSIIVNWNHLAHLSNTRCIRSCTWSLIVVQWTSSQRSSSTLFAIVSVLDQCRRIFSSGIVHSQWIAQWIETHRLCSSCTSSTRYQTRISSNIPSDHYRTTYSSWRTNCIT